jgi:hypothetical protein
VHAKAHSVIADDEISGTLAPHASTGMSRFLPISTLQLAQLGCKVLNLPGNDLSTYLDGMKAWAGCAHARLTSIGVQTP